MRVAVLRTLEAYSAPPRKAPSYAERDSRIGEQVRREDGVAAACDALEGLF